MLSWGMLCCRLSMVALESVRMITCPSLRDACVRASMIATVSAWSEEALPVTQMDVVVFLVSKPAPAVWFMGSTDPSVE